MVAMTVAEAAPVAIDKQLVTMAVDSANSTDSKIAINFIASESSIAGGKAAVKVPDAVQPYIKSATWDTSKYSWTLKNGDGTFKVGGNTKADYYTMTVGTSSGEVDISSTKNVFMTLNLELVDGGIPSTVSAADRTLTLGGEVNTGRTASLYCTLSAASVNSGSESVAYIAADSKATPVTMKNAGYWTVDPTAAGNYVVLPTAAPAEKHVEVAVKNAKGEAVNLETPNYNYSDVNGDVAVAFMATVTPNNDTVNGLTWTVKSGDVEKQFAKTFGGTITGAAVSYGLIVKGIDTVQSVNAAATVVE